MFLLIVWNFVEIWYQRCNRLKCFCCLWLCGSSSLNRATRGAPEFPVLSHSGHPPGLPPQLRWPHPGHHGRTDGGGRQGFSNVGPHLCVHTHAHTHTRAAEPLCKQHLASDLCLWLAALWTRRRITWRTSKRRKDAPPASSLTEQVRDVRTNTRPFLRQITQTGRRELPCD